MGRLRLLAVAAVVSVVLTGCFTGERPSFAPPQAQVDDLAIAAVVERLEAGNDTQFTAEYSIFTKLTVQPTQNSSDIAAGATTTSTAPGSNVTKATVARSSATSLSITVGNVRYLDDNGNRQTCDLVSATCEPDLLDARLSTILVTHDFYAASPAMRIRQDASAMVSAGVASSREIAGQTATCVQISFAAGNKVYCALDNGLLAYQDTPDVQIELVALTVGADPTLFTTSSVAG